MAELENAMEMDGAAIIETVGEPSAANAKGRILAELLPEDLLKHGALDEFEDVPSLAGSYVRLAEELSHVPKPPETEDAYTLTIAEGLSADERIADEFKKVAFDAGLSQTQADKLVEWQNSLALRAIKEAAEKNVAERNNAETVLKDAWKENYDRNLDASRRALQTVGDPELSAFLDESGLANNPMVIRMFYRLGSILSEDVMVQGGSSYGKERSAAETLYPGT